MTAESSTSERRPITVSRVLRALKRRSGMERLETAYYTRVGWPGVGSLAGYRVSHPEVNWYAAGISEPHMTKACVGVIKPGWTAVDVGAHKGYFTLLFSRLVGPTGKVIAFEAHRDNAAVLRRSIARNRLEGRVTIENVAITDGASKTISLHRGRPGTSFEWNVIGRDADGNPTEQIDTVAAVSLDQYFKSGEKVDFLKMDIEGAEAMAIPAMMQMVASSRPLALLEFHTPEAWETRKLLFAAGYRLYDVAAERWVERAEGRVHQVLAVPAERAGLLGG